MAFEGETALNDDDMNGIIFLEIDKKNKKKSPIKRAERAVRVVLMSFIFGLLIASEIVKVSSRPKRNTHLTHDEFVSVDQNSKPSACFWLS